MKSRSVRQFFVQPKVFHSIGFHHQATYQIRIFLCQIDVDRNILYGTPNTIKLLDKKQEFEEQLRLNTNGKPFFSTQKFYVGFNDQSQGLQNGVLFNIQYQDETCMTYLDFQLIKFQNIYAKKIKGNQQHAKTEQDYKSQKSEQENKIKQFKTQKLQKELKQQEQIEKLVSKKRIILNVSIKQDSRSESLFQRVFFSKSEYYSCLYIFIDHVKFYQKIRINQYDLFKFSRKTKQQQKRLIQNAKKIRQECQNSFLLQPSVFECQTSGQVYEKLIKQTISEYNRVCNIYRKLSAILMVYSNSESNFFSNIFSEQMEDSAKKPRNLDYIQNELKKAMKIEKDQVSRLIFEWYDYSIQIGNNIRYVWNKIVRMVSRLKNTIFLKHAKQANQISNKKYFENFEVLQKDSIGKSWNLLLAEHKQKRNQFFSKQKIYFQAKTRHPMIIVSRKFDENVKSSKSQQRLQISQILTIFVHGYMGNQYDMSKMKSNLCQYFNSAFYVVKSIQKIMQQDIEGMADAAAKQVGLYLQKRPVYNRINFIGFSLGGLVIRAMAPKLEEFKQKFNAIITFASPHLGVSKVNHCIVKMGLCCMKRVGQVKNMKQLYLQDQNLQDLEQALLTKLSKSNSLRWFKHVICVGCHQDQYVPTYSSLLQYQGEDSLIINMQKNIERRVQDLHKINVWFDTKQNWQDWISRRKAHVSFLDNDCFLDFFFARYWKML